MKHAGLPLSLLFTIFALSTFSGCDRPVAEKSDPDAKPTLASRDVVRDAARSLADSGTSVDLPKAFDDETYGLHLRYPADWVEGPERRDNRDAGPLFRIDHHDGDVVSAMIFINVHPPDESLFQMSEEDMTTYVKAGARHPEAIGFERTHFAGADCLATRFLDTHDGSQRIVMRMYEFHHRDHRFSVHLAVSEDAAETHAPVFEAVLASFRLD